MYFQQPYPSHPVLLFILHFVSVFCLLFFCSSRAMLWITHRGLHIFIHRSSIIIFKMHEAKAFTIYILSHGFSFLPRFFSVCSRTLCRFSFDIFPFFSLFSFSFDFHELLTGSAVIVIAVVHCHWLPVLLALSFTFHILHHPGLQSSEFRYCNKW